MAAIYLGFTVEQMLNFLNENSRSVVLVKNDINDDGGFRLTTYSDEFGEYDGTGSLSRIVIGAFKPFVQRAKQEREGNIKALCDILKTPVMQTTETARQEKC